MAQRMAHAAEHDFLTGLPNRMLLNDRVDRAIGLVGRHTTRVAMLFLDLDGFKHINDSLGHSTGDKLLQSVARRLVECVRDSDTVSRQGGDEFVVHNSGGRLEGFANSPASKWRAPRRACVRWSGVKSSDTPTRPGSVCRPTADRHHSGLMLAVRITLAHFSVSSAKSLP